MSTQPAAKSNLVARTAVSVEYASLMGQGHCPLGIYVLPTSGDLMIWDGVLFVHQGKLESLIAVRRAPLTRLFKASTPTL
jgi:hypothetical protein